MPVGATWCRALASGFIYLKSAGPDLHLIPAFELALQYSRRWVAAAQTSWNLVSDWRFIKVAPMLYLSTRCSKLTAFAILHPIHSAPLSL